MYGRRRSLLPEKPPRPPRARPVKHRRETATQGGPGHDRKVLENGKRGYAGAADHAGGDVSAKYQGTNSIGAARCGAAAGSDSPIAESAERPDYGADGARSAGRG